MKRTFIVAVAVSLCAVSPNVVGAKKASKDLTFYLHFPSADGTCGSPYMDLEADTPDSSCGFTFQPANEAFHVTGLQDALSGDWPASEGLPLRLDVKRPVTAQLALMNFFGRAASGHGIVDLKVVGVANGKSATLIEESVSLDMVPAVAGSNFAEFEVKLPKKLAGKKFKSLVATTMVRGVNNFHYFDLDGEPLAHIVVPTE